MTKLVQQLHLVLKMLFLRLVYLLKNWNFLIILVIVKRMKIMLMWQDECWLVRFSRKKWIKLIIIQIARDNGNAINDSNSTAFNKPSFFVTRYSYHYLLLNSNILDEIADLIHKEGRRIYLSFVVCSTHKEPITVRQECSRPGAFNWKSYE